MTVRFSQLVENAEGFPKLMKVPMFRAGDYQEKGKYTERDLDLMAQSYDPAYLEAPITRDHVEYGPADGWIDRVYREGDTLFGDWTVHPETLRLLQEGLFKRRSIEFYRKHTMPDGSVVPYVKACSILGAATPHCKGMPNIQFADDSESFSVDFETNEIKISKGNTKVKFNLPAQYARFASRFTEDMSEEEKNVQFSKVLEEIAEENQAALSEKDTKIASLNTKVDEQGVVVAQILADNRKAKAEKKFDEAVAANREAVTPAMEKYLRALFLREAETALSETFAFDDRQVHVTDLIVEFIAELPAIVSLSNPTIHNLRGLNKQSKFNGRPDPSDVDALRAFNDQIMKDAEVLCKENPELDLADAMIEAERRLSKTA